MYTNNTLVSAAASLSVFTGSANNSADGSFADIFGSRLKGSSENNSGLEAILNKLSSRFPNAKVNVTNSGKAEAAEEENEDVKESEKTDSVNVDSSLLPAMTNSADLFKKVEEAISAFLDSAAGTNAMSGAYAYRSVTISITAVTYQSQQRYSDSDELAFSQDLQTSYQDMLKEKLQELINRAFGLDGTSSSKDETDTETSESSSVESSTGTEASATSPSKTGQGNWSGFGSYASLSMSLYYSNTMIQSLGENGAQGSNTNFQSFMFSASYQSMSGFQNFASSDLPQSIFGQLERGNSALSDPFASLFEGSLGKMGLTSGGFSQTTDGFLFNFRNGRDFLSEYLEMTGWGKQPESIGTEAEEKVEAAPEAVAEAEG